MGPFGPISMAAGLGRIGTNPPYTPPRSEATLPKTVLDALSGGSNPTKWQTRREPGTQSHGTHEVSRVAEGIHIDVLERNALGQRATLSLRRAKRVPSPMAGHHCNGPASPPRTCPVVPVSVGRCWQLHAHHDRFRRRRRRWSPYRQRHGLLGTRMDRPSMGQQVHRHDRTGRFEQRLHCPDQHSGRRGVGFPSGLGARLQQERQGRSLGTSRGASR
jgi:hypothetical protein